MAAAGKRRRVPAAIHARVGVAVLENTKAPAMMPGLW